MMETRKTSSQTDRTTDMEGDIIHLEVLTSGGVPYKPENSNPSNFVKFEGMKWIPSGEPEQQPKWSTSAETASLPYPKAMTTEATNSQARTLERSVRDNITFGDPNMQVYKLEKSKDNSGVLDTRPVISLPETSHLNLVQGQQSVINEMSPRLVYMIPQSSSDTVGNVNFVLPKADVVKETVTYQSKLEKAVTKAGRRKQRKSSVQLPGVSAISSSIVNSPIINTSPIIATSVHGPIPIQEGDPRLLAGTTQPNSGPLFIAVPLSNLAVDLKNTNSNSEGVNTSITNQKYQELISTAFTTETPNSSRQDAGQDDGNHAPVLQAQTQADINLSIGDSSVDRSTGISSELKRQFEMAFNPRLSSFPKPDQVAKLEEKTYEDEGLSHTILKAMWHMIEADLFWDGILYIGKHHIKLHKLVMASISSVVHAKILSSDEPVLKIKLPVDLDHSVVRSFVKYLYHGTISITTNNVRDLYRMSTIFELEKLKKYCYDFCKLTKMAHIIINSPQEDSMKAVQFGEVENKQDEPEITNIVDEIANETNDLIDNIDLEASEITLGLRKAEDKKQEPVFDWLGIDEDQSNIPIRKRGRTRKGILNQNNVAFKTIINAGDNISADNLNDKTVKEPYANSQGVYENRKEEATMIIANVRSIGERNEDSKVQNDTEEASMNQTGSKNIEEAIDQETSLLPDPFDGGKFDESKLTKKTTVQPRTMVTRYRGKNKNILEAATNKKARLDEGEQKHLEVEEHSSTKSEKTPSRRPRAVNKRKQDDSLELTPEMAQEKENIVIPTDSQNTEAGPTSPQQLLKKTRPKRSTSEQESPQKKETPMRPPPKKRTKEIREMMRSVDKSSQNPFVETLIKDELTAMKKQEKKKRTVNPGHLCLPKTKLLVEKILEIDEKGSDIVGDRMYRCEFCGNEYICAKRILTHVVKTHDILLDETADHISVLKKNLSPKVCDVCGYKAKDANIYYIHFHKYFRHGVPLPQGWKPFKCDFCGKEFFTKFQLKDHKLTHFEETPFVCEHCGNGFKTRTCLNSHVFHKHSTVKRHKCPECVKTFKTHTQMIVHTRTHSGEKPFGCPHCIYRSTTRGNLRLHLANRHKFETEYITKIMKEVKAIDTGTAPSIDEDGNVIRLKESGFAVKLGQVDGEVLQIDPAGSSETRSMDTLADVASSKASDDSRRNLRNETANEQTVQNETLMSGVDATKTFENQYSQVSFDDVKAVSVGHQEIHSLQEGDFLDVSRPLHLVISNNVENSLEMQVVTSEYAGGSYRADDTTITAPTESKLIHDIRNAPNVELQTQESRMIVRDILHQLDVRPQIDSRSLLKAALMQGPDQNLDNRGVADAQIIQVPESFFQEGTNLVAEQIGDNLLSVPNQYADNRLQSYDTSRNVTAEPLQLVINTANLQSKSEQQTVQRYHNPIQSPQPYSDGCAIKSHQSEIPTIISEEMQQAEQLEDQTQAQGIGANQTYEGNSQPHAETHLSEEQVLMYQNYYQQNYHHGYQ